jgi:hypothetical protein
MFLVKFIKCKSGFEIGRDSMIINANTKTEALLSFLDIIGSQEIRIIDVISIE